MGGKIIKVNVANGSPNHIWCRVAGDKAFKVKGAAGGGINVQGIGINAQNVEQVQYVVGASRGYSQIQRGKTLQFETATSSKSVYMTIISESDAEICKNHEITKNRNYIIDRDDGLLAADTKNKWKDKNGLPHFVSYSDEPHTKTNFEPSERFTRDYHHKNQISEDIYFNSESPE